MVSKKLNVHFSHKSDDWATPEPIYSFFMKLGFVDPCPLFCSFDAFSRCLNGNLFINPPYSDLSRWADLAISHFRSHKFVQVWLLVPARTDTKWFKKFVDFGSNLVFISGRLKFGSSKNFAPFPSCLIHLCGTSTDCLWVDSNEIVSFLSENVYL